jgi:hypothetical protein
VRFSRGLPAARRTMFPRTPFRRTARFRRILEQSGWAGIQVSFVEWDACKGDHRAQVRLCVSLWAALAELPGGAAEYAVRRTTCCEASWPPSRRLRGTCSAQKRQSDEKAAKKQTCSTPAKRPPQDDPKTTTTRPTTPQTIGANVRLDERRSTDHAVERRLVELPNRKALC